MLQGILFDRKRISYGNEHKVMDIFMKKLFLGLLLPTQSFPAIRFITAAV